MTLDKMSRRQVRICETEDKADLFIAGISGREIAPTEPPLKVFALHTVLVIYCVESVERQLCGPPTQGARRAPHPAQCEAAIGAPLPFNPCHARASELSRCPRCPPLGISGPA